MNRARHYRRAHERLTAIARGHKLRYHSDGRPYLPCGRARIEGDAGSLVAIVSRHETTLLRRLSGRPGIGTPQRFGEDVHILLRGDGVDILARLARLE